MFQTIQCVNNPLGASGSSTMRASALAAGGIASICRAGLVSEPSHVNLDGISPPSLKTELLIFIFCPPAANNEQAIAAIAMLAPPRFICLPPLELDRKLFWQ